MFTTPASPDRLRGPCPSEPGRRSLDSRDSEESTASTARWSSGPLFDADIVELGGRIHLPVLKIPRPLLRRLFSAASLDSGDSGSATSVKAPPAPPAPPADLKPIAEA